MMRWALWCFLFLTDALLASHLRERFCDAQVGSYIVTERDRVSTLLHVHSRRDDELILEEISIPSVHAKNLDWKAWLREGAPGHTSWVMYAIDLEKFVVTNYFSFSTGQYPPIEAADFLSTLLFGLDLRLLPDAERPHIDSQRIWAPPQYREGKRVNDPLYEVYSALWPKDRSEFAGKEVVFYFDKRAPRFPFPYWMQLRKGGVKLKVQAIDSGDGLISPRKVPPPSPRRFREAVHK